MSKDDPTPIKHDYFTEACEIASGMSSRRPKPQHVKALYDAFATLSGAHEKLVDLFQKSVAAVQAKRTAQGLPPLPSPPGELAGMGLKPGMEPPRVVKP